MSRRMSGEDSDIGLPQTSTVPSSGRSAPTRQRSSVDLPGPLRPVRATASPVRTSRLKLLRMVFGPNARRSPDTLRTVVRLATASIVPLVPAGQIRRQGTGRFAPTNDAFAKIDKATPDDDVLADKATLTAILTEHVVGQRLSPDMVAGEFGALNPKQGVSVEGAEEDFTVNGSRRCSAATCNADATIYIIDNGAPAEVVARPSGKMLDPLTTDRPTLGPRSRAFPPGTLSRQIPGSQFGEEVRISNPTTGFAPNRGQSKRPDPPRPGHPGRFFVINTSTPGSR